MKKRLLINDFKANKLVTISTCVFMAISAMLLGLSILLFGSLSSAIDSLMIKAKTPDFLQMHVGEIDEKQIIDFAESRDEIETLQICRFLNLQNSQITIGETSLINNMQDNGLCCQNDSFDFLIDSNDEIIRPNPKEVYVPVCYKIEYGIEVGDVMSIGSEKLIVAGFLRDSQMNSMMASSKRFLVSEVDYQRIKYLGTEEYLIEFKLKEGCDTSIFSTAYEDAGLPKNGPTITYPLIKMMNALSDGIMILVVLLVSMVVLFISIMCIRYMILTQLEKDKQEIGMMKAVGISKIDILKLYFSKYLLLSVIGGIIGVVIALIISKPLAAQMQALYGKAGNMNAIYILMVLGAIIIETIILLSVYFTLSKMNKMSAVDVMRGEGSFGRKKNLYVPIGIITVATMFMILVPWNIKTTITAPEFVTYMGIGESQIRIDIRQTENVDSTALKVINEIKRDNRVQDYSLMNTSSYKCVLSNDMSYNLLIENGDHSQFPVRYIEGKYPEVDGEIALSILNCEQMNLKVGDTIYIHKETDGLNKSSTAYKVCGIYSDITNGGKTAKSCFNKNGDKTKTIWSVIYISLEEENNTDSWIKDFRSKFSEFTDEIKVVKISDYIIGTYGQTINNIQKTTILSIFLSSLILFVVILLLMRLLIWKERRDISLQKALGFTSNDVKVNYLKKVSKYILPAMIIGVFVGVVPGQSLAGILLSSMGAYGFNFIINPLVVFIVTPLVILLSAIFASMISLKEINRVSAYECLQTH